MSLGRTSGLLVETADGEVVLRSKSESTAFATESVSLSAASLLRPVAGMSLSERKR